MQVKRETAPMTKVDNKLDIILEYEARLHQEYEQQKYISYFAKQWVNNTIEKCKGELSDCRAIVRHNDTQKNIAKSAGFCFANFEKNQAFWNREFELMTDVLIVAERMLEYIEEREK